MTRNRFEEIMQLLHLSNNENPAAKDFKAWKVKDIVDVLETTFKDGFTVRPSLVFDEGLIPGKSRYNPMRQYPSAKPHPWDTKCYVTCDSASGYCCRYVILTASQLTMYCTAQRLTCLRLYSTVARSIKASVQAIERISTKARMR